MFHFVGSILTFISMIFSIVNELKFKLPPNKQMLQLFFRNIPHVHLHEKRENKEHWRGAEIQVVIEGNWTTYRVHNTYVMKC